MKFQYILGIIILIALATTYYSYNPEMYTFFPECPFHKYLHLDCPGCGSQRAVHALLHGNIRKALDFNILMVASLPLLLLHFVLKVTSYVTNKDYDLKIWQKPLVPKLIFILVLAFWIARNIPAKPFTYLAA